MIKAIELIVVVTLMIFSFFIGVKYAENVKSHASWLFETKEEEVDLPDLTNENNGEAESTVYDSGDSLESSDQMPEAVDSVAAPMESNLDASDQNVNAGVPATNASAIAPAKTNKRPVKNQ